MGSFTSVTVGVADLDAALTLWSGAMALDVIARRDGPDTSLAALWRIAAGDVRSQALLATPGSALGRLHLVEFERPGEAIRRNAQTFDLCPKNLDVYVRDMPACHARLRKLGYRFRNDRWSDVTAPDGQRFREIHLPAHDDVNVVLLELVGADIRCSSAGFAAVGPLIAVVPDEAREGDFVRSVLDLRRQSHNELAGPDVEAMIGLPPGAGLGVAIWGQAGQPMGQLEFVEYRGVSGRDLYPRTRPPACGILNVSYRVADLGRLLERLVHVGARYERHGVVDTLACRGEAVSFATPAGLRIEAIAAR